MLAATTPLPVQVCDVLYYFDINIKDFPELSYLFLMKIGRYQTIPEPGDLPPTYRVCQNEFGLFRGWQYLHTAAAVCTTNYKNGLCFGDLPNSR